MMTPPTRLAGRGEALRRLRAGLNGAVWALQGQAGRLRALQASLRWTGLEPEEVRRRQLARLRAVLVHAKATVPYYREVFEERGFRPEAMESASELQDLPVLTKGTIREQGERMISSLHRPAELMERKTGGSTGEPLTFYVTRAEYEEQIGIAMRSNVLVGIRPGDTMAKVWGYSRSLDLANALSPVTGRLYLDVFHSEPEDLDRWVRWLERVPPRMIYGYPTAIHQLAAHLRLSGRTISGIDVIATTAEKLFDEQRAPMEESLGGRVVDMYGCHEVPRLASECLEGRMHVAPDAAVIEFLGGDGGDEDEPRRIVVTSLSSFAMPLVRYDVGDLGRALPGDCPCGLPFPLMSIDVGKVHHLFALPRGRRLNSVRLHKPIYHLSSIDRFQIRHEALDRIAVVYVPRPGREGEAAKRLEAELAPLRQELGDEVRLTVRAVDAIGHTGRGKQPAIVSLVTEDGQPRLSRHRR